MQATESTAISGRRRVEAVMETLAAIHIHGDSLEELAHDARNMVTALSLYCDLLEEPGVLSPACRHYGSELRLVIEASRRLVEKVAHAAASEGLDHLRQGISALQGLSDGAGRDPARRGWPLAGLGEEPLPDGLIEDLREEILAIRNLLSAIAGPSITVSVKAAGGAGPIRMSSENLIRALVNLVRNAAECISGAGSIDIRLADRERGAGGAPSLVLTVEDSGCGIPAEFLDKVFEPRFTTRRTAPAGTRPDLKRGAPGSGPEHRGLGLSITRSVVETAGGTIRAENRSEGGARFVVEIPVRRP